MIPFSKVSIGDEEQAAVRKVLASGWLAAGPETAAFEKEFAEYIGAKYFVFTNCCTSALKISYKWAKTKGYKSICYPKNTFCATYSAAEEMGLKSYTIDELPLGPEGPDWQSIAKVSMHYGGVLDPEPCLIEDSAHRIEANDTWTGRIKCYSFYSTKNLACGSGGGLATNDKEIYDFARLQWRDGLTTSTADRANGKLDYRVEAMAGGYDGNDIAAAIGRVQLRRLPGFTKRRNEIVQRYNDRLAQDWTGNHLYPFMVDSVEAVFDLIAYLRDKGISAGYHYPGTGWTGVSLPLYPSLTNDEVSQICEAVLEWRKNNGRLLPNQ